MTRRPSSSRCSRRCSPLSAARAQDAVVGDGRGRQRDLPPRSAAPTLLIWDELDARARLNVARQLEEAIPDTKLVVIRGAGHLHNLEWPERFNVGVHEFLPRPPAASDQETSGSPLRGARAKSPWQAAGSAPERPTPRSFKARVESYLRDHGRSTTVQNVAALDSTPNRVCGALGSANVECEDGRYRHANGE